VAETRYGPRMIGDALIANPHAELTRHGAHRKDAASGLTAATYKDGVDKKEDASARPVLTGTMMSTLAS
jgi:hypothetical protein